MGVGELFSAGTDEVDVRAFFEYEAGGLNGIAKALDTGYAAGLHAAAVHEQGVKLDASVGGEEAAAASVEGGVVFKYGNGGFDGVKGGTAEGEDFVAGFEGVAHAGFVGACGVGGDGPGASVDEEGGIVSGLGGHGDMVAHKAVNSGQ